MGDHVNRYIEWKTVYAQRVSSCRLKLCSQSNIKYQTNIADLVTSEILEHGYQIEKFVVMCVREPAADGNGVLRVEDI